MNSPELRFSEFDSAWNKHELADIAKIQRGRFSPRPRNNPIYYGGDYPFVQTSDVVNATGFVKRYTQSLNDKGLKVSKLFPQGTILITIAANIGYSAVLEIPMACPDSLIGITCDNETYNIFLNYTLEKEQPKMDYLAVEAAQKNINIAFLEIYPVSVPSWAEQQKVADFLTTVDTRIQQLSQKKTLLERWKKGLMQQLFSQTIRFKDDDGNDFPEWKEKKLGNIAEFLRGGALSKSDLDLDGDFPCIHYGELFTRYDEKISIVYSRTNKDNGVRSNSGDLLMPSSDVTPVGLATASMLIDEGVVLGGDINVIRPKPGSDSLYLSYYLNHFKNPIIRLVTGTTVKHIYNKDLRSLSISLPSKMEEQTKIANCLSAIDKKIDAVSQQIGKTKTFKQGLLQQMFV